MPSLQDLKALWKRLGVKGQVKNYSSRPLWVLETDTGKALAYLLSPMTKSPIGVDADAFRRKDGQSIDGHSSWWKIYDFSTADVFDKGMRVKVSAITKTAVSETHFGPVTYDDRSKWGAPIQLVTDVQRDKKRRIISYCVSGVGWVDPDQFLVMTCNHEVDNARPVFTSTGGAYVRTRRDPELFNNLEVKG